MRGSGYHRHPLPPELVAGLAALVLTLGTLFVLGAITYAYRGLGIGEDALFGLLILSLAGGVVNIPVGARGRSSASPSSSCSACATGCRS